MRVHQLVLQNFVHDPKPIPVMQTMPVCHDAPPGCCLIVYSWNVKGQISKLTHN